MQFGFIVHCVVKGFAQKNAKLKIICGMIRLVIPGLYRERLRNQHTSAYSAYTVFAFLFNEVDILLTDEMEELCGHIRMVAEAVKTTPSETRQRADQERLVQSGTSITLPKIELPKFNGDVVQWCSFRDMFLSLVHNNQNISDMERFYFLKSCLIQSLIIINYYVFLFKFGFIYKHILYE